MSQRTLLLILFTTSVGTLAAYQGYRSIEYQPVALNISRGVASASDDQKPIYARELGQKNIIHISIEPDKKHPASSELKLTATIQMDYFPDNQVEFKWILPADAKYIEGDQEGDFSAPFNSNTMSTSIVIEKNDELVSGDVISLRAWGVFSGAKLGSSFDFILK